MRLFFRLLTECSKRHYTTRENIEKMASPAARTQYCRRSQVADLRHAWIKSKLGLRQFHVRGLAKVQMEMLWACFTYNLQHWIRLNKFRATAAVT